MSLATVVFATDKNSSEAEKETSGLPRFSILLTGESRCLAERWKCDWIAAFAAMTIGD
jgi:hypothetical protein